MYLRIISQYFVLEEIINICEPNIEKAAQPNGAHFVNGPISINQIHFTPILVDLKPHSIKKTGDNGARALSSFSSPGFDPSRLRSRRCSCRQLEGDRRREQPSRAGDREVRGGGAQQADGDEEAEVPERDQGRVSGRRRHKLPADVEGEDRRSLEEVQGGCVGEAG